MLSLGTGSYISDSLDTDLNKGQLSCHKVVLPQQEGNTDRLMYSLLENRYQRWQVWLEEPIELNDCKSTQGSRFRFNFEIRNYSNLIKYSKTF